MISDYFVGRYLKSFPFGNKSVSICNKEELSKPSHYSIGTSSPVDSVMS
jgi:hypothetical protein